MKNLKRTELDFLTVVYVAILTFGVGVFVVHPSGTGLVALLCMIPAVVISLAFPTKRTKVVTR
jgi:hypothetical protein